MLVRSYSKVGHVLFAIARVFDPWLKKHFPEFRMKYFGTF